MRRYVTIGSIVVTTLFAGSVTAVAQPVAPPQCMPADQAVLAGAGTGAGAPVPALPAALPGQQPAPPPVSAPPPIPAIPPVPSVVPPITPPVPTSLPTPAPGVTPPVPAPPAQPPVAGYDPLPAQQGTTEPVQGGPISDQGDDPEPDPDADPSSAPDEDPSEEPGEDQGTDPGDDQGEDPGEDPGQEPTAEPSAEPSAEPRVEPGVEPGAAPIAEPSAGPSAGPTTEPSPAPTTGAEPPAPLPTGPGGLPGRGRLPGTVPPPGGAQADPVEGAALDEALAAPAAAPAVGPAAEGPCAVPSEGHVSSAASMLSWGAPNRVDEFTGPLDPAWSVYTGTGHDGKGLRSPDAMSMKDGVLTITGDEKGTTAGMAWTGGQKYGRWEGRVRVPAGDASYNALLLLWPDAQDFPVGGEVDFMELQDPARQAVNAFLHHGTENAQVAGVVQMDATQWHNWAVEWTPDYIATFVDGKEWWRTTGAEKLPPGPMHLCVQLDWFPRADGPVIPSQMQVDWVKQYPLNPPVAG